MPQANLFVKAGRSEKTALRNGQQVHNVLVVVQILVFLGRVAVLARRLLHFHNVDAVDVHVETGCEKTVHITTAPFQTQLDVMSIDAILPHVVVWIPQIDDIV